MVIAPVIPLKVVLEYLEGPLIASYQVSKQWCESTNRNCGLVWEKMWSLECADLTKGCFLSQTLVFICLVDNSSRGDSSASLWHCCSARHKADFPVEESIEIERAQTPTAAWNGLFWNHGQGGMWLRMGSCLRAAWKMRGSRSCYRESVVVKIVVTPKGSGAFFSWKVFWVRTNVHESTLLTLIDSWEVGTMSHLLCAKWRSQSPFVIRIINSPAQILRIIQLNLSSCSLCSQDLHLSQNI